MSKVRMKSLVLPVYQLTRSSSSGISDQNRYRSVEKMLLLRIGLNLEMSRLN